MDKSACGNALLPERTVDPGVFEGMDSFELSDSEKFALSIKLQFPKFSKGFSPSDFEPFIDEHIGLENVVSLGRLCFPNEWQMQVNNKDIREKLIRLGRTKINTRTCWISPLSQSEVRGYVHWVPTAIENRFIEETLTPFGELVFIENQKQTKWKKIDSDSRYFALNLKPGQVVEDIPHFTKIKDHSALITIKGRNPCCFHCREVGHRKSECKKYREKLSDYNARMPHGKRIKPRGRRHRPEQVKKMLAAEAAGQKSNGATSKIAVPQTTTKSKKKNKKAKNKTEGNTDVTKAKMDANTFKGTIESITLPKTIESLKTLMPTDDTVKKHISYLEDFVTVLLAGGNAFRDNIDAFRNKWPPEINHLDNVSPESTADVPETDVVSPTEATDEIKENPVNVSEGKKKKKKRKKNKSKKVELQST